MNKLFIMALVVIASFAVTSASAQVHVSVGFERTYPGYTYYSYPAWNGHYRDRAYYAHYHRTFEREHRDYFRGRRFDHDRFEHDRQSGRWHEHH